MINAADWILKEVCPICTFLRKARKGCLSNGIEGSVLVMFESPLGYDHLTWTLRISDLWSVLPCRAYKQVLPQPF